VIKLITVFICGKGFNTDVSKRVDLGLDGGTLLGTWCWIDASVSHSLAELERSMASVGEPILRRVCCDFFITCFPGSGIDSSRRGRSLAHFGVDRVFFLLDSSAVASSNGVSVDSRSTSYVENPDSADCSVCTSIGTSHSKCGNNVIRSSVVTDECVDGLGVDVSVRFNDAVGTSSAT